MREFKFRAWDSKNKKFPFDGFHIIGEVTVFDLIKQYKLEEFNDLEVTQYTGIKDKNKKEICEGDILEYYRFVEVGKDNEPEISDVVFNCGSFWVGKTALFCFNTFYLEVVGNIFENHDLLKKDIKNGQEKPAVV